MTKVTDYELFDRDTQAFVYNLKANPIQRMLDFDCVCGRGKPSVSGIIHPGRNGFQKVFWKSIVVLP